MTESAEFELRRVRAREEMRRHGIDAIIAYSNPKTRGPVRYLSGYFTLGVGANSRPDGTYYQFGSTALLLPIDHEPLLLTDIPFDIMRARVMSTVDDVRVSDNLGRDLGHEIAANGYRVVAIDNWYVFPAVHYLALTAEAPAAKITGTHLVQDLMRVKSASEVGLLRDAASVAMKAMAAGFAAVRVGGTDFEFALAAECALRQHGELETAGVSIGAGGPRTATATSSPTQREPYVMQRGDWALFDLAPRYAGYTSDMARMVVAGRLSDLDPSLAKLYAATLEMHDRVIAAIRPGVTPRDLNAIATATAEELGYGAHRSSLTGHGLGQDVHEIPDYHYDRKPLEANVCFTVEPSLFAPGVAATRIEDVVVVTSSGCDVLTAQFPTALRGTEDD